MKVQVNELYHSKGLDRDGTVSMYVGLEPQSMRWAAVAYPKAEDMLIRYGSRQTSQKWPP